MFNTCPLLLYSLMFGMGIISYAAFHPVLLFPCSLCLYFAKKRALLSILLFLAGFVWQMAPASPSQTEHLIKIEDIKEKKDGIYIKGMRVPSMEPISVPIPKKDFPLLSGIKVKGNIKDGRLKIDKDAPVYPIESFHTFAPARFLWKKWVQEWIYEKYPHIRSARLLSALITGDLDDKQLRQDFGRFGLQHILAISGFHFSLIALMLGFLFRSVLPFSYIHRTLFIFLTGYFFFLGLSPSIIRAWSAVAAVLIGYTFSRSTDPLNNLGLGLFLVALLDPHGLLTPGCVLSFVLTAAILLYFSPIDGQVKKIFRGFSFKDAVEMSHIDQIGVIILSFFRKSLSLNIAVSLMAIPLTLYYFQTFPLLSLFYNLFFPFLISLTLFLFILGAFPLVGTAISTINSYYTDFILNMLHEAPPQFDIRLETTHIEGFLITIYLTIILCWGLHKKYQNV